MYILTKFTLFMLLLLSLVYFLFAKKRVIMQEGYESLDTCLKQGYPKSFCFQVPIQACLTNCN